MKSWSSLRLGCRVIRQTYSAVALRRPVACVSNDSGRSLSTQELNVVRSPYADILVPDVSLPEFVWEMVDKHPEHTALVCGLTGRKYTYAESRGTAHRFAASLRKMGFKFSDTLAVVLANIPEFPLVMLGAIEAGCIVTTVNPAFTPDEIRKQLKDSGANGVVTMPEIFSNVSKAVSMIETERKSKIPLIITPGLTVQSVPQGTVSFLDMIHREIDTSILAADDRPNPGSVVPLE